MKKLKTLPKFKNEDEERRFWDKADTSAYFDWNKAQFAVFPNLKPSTESISLRLPKFLLQRIKLLANHKDVPYQSLMKVYLSEALENDMRGNGGAMIFRDVKVKRKR